MTIPFVLTFSPERLLQKYKIGHRSYFLCLGIRFILLSECLYPDLSAPDLLDSRATFASICHLTMQELHNCTLIPNPSHPRCHSFVLGTVTFFPTDHKLILELDNFFIHLIVTIICLALTI